ncbi:outer membrane protein assembly factor BamB family protein [Embleya sp. NPDC001921]
MPTNGTLAYGSFTGGPPTSGRSGGRGPRTKIVAASVIAALVLAGGVAAWLLSDSGGDSENATAKPGSAAPTEPVKARIKPPRAAPALEEAWTAPVPPGDTLESKPLAMWHTGSSLYVGRGTGVQILDMADGRVLGSVAPPKQGMAVCGMTETPNGSGLGAIAWSTKAGAYNAACNQVSLVDTRQGGNVLWTTEFHGTKKDGSPFDTDETRLGFIGEDLLAVMTPNTVVALRTADRSQAWTWRNPTTQDGLWSNESFRTTSDRVLVSMSFGASVFRKSYSVAAIDAAGQPLWDVPTSVPVPEQGAVHVVSARPLTAVVEPSTFKDEQGAQLVVFDDTGKIARTIPLRGDFGKVESYGKSMHGTLHAPAMHVRGNTMYALTKREVGQGFSPRQAIAFDLDTGAVRWVKPAGQNRDSVLIDADEEGAYVLDVAFRNASTLTRFAPDGTATQVSTVAQPKNSMGMGMQDIGRLENGHLVMFSGLASFGVTVYGPSTSTGPSTSSGPSTSTGPSTSSGPGTSSGLTAPTG